MKTQFLLRLVFVAAVMSFPVVTGNACSVGGEFRFSHVFTADLIVRATATDYKISPDPVSPTGWSASTVEFKIEEALRGAEVPKTIVLDGYLIDRDDYNDTPLPYRVVRSGGRGGPCFARNYKKGEQFLLFLKRDGSGYTTNFVPLGPTNEQLHDADDPWVKWVKAYLTPCVSQGDQSLNYGDRLKSEFEVLISQAQADLEKYRIAKCYVAKFGTGDALRYTRIIEFYDMIQRNTR